MVGGWARPYRTGLITEVPSIERQPAVKVGAGGSPTRRDVAAVLAQHSPKHARPVFSISD
jgi:hypothetical protein